VKILNPISRKNLYQCYVIDGLTKRECAEKLKTTLSAVEYRIIKYGICPRKRGVSGERNPRWGGDKISYTAFHKRVYAARGKATKCEVCKSKNEAAYHWANITGNLGDVFDYKQMCASCHKKHDDKINPRKPRTCAYFLADGKSYESLAALMAAHGISRQTVYNRCASPNFPSWERVKS